MKKLILFFLLLIATSQRAEANLSISSFYILFDANSPKRTDVVRITNHTNSKKTYRIKLINFKQNADGSYTGIDTSLPGNPFASPYLVFSPHETTLDPGQVQVVRLVRNPMAAAPDGEYVSHLSIQEMPEKNVPVTANPDQQLRINIKALYGVTIPVIIDKGDLNSSASFGKTKIITCSEKPCIEVTLKRTGNRSFWGNLIVKDNGQEIGRINNFKIFMTTPERRIKIPLTAGATSSTSIILQDARTNAIIASKTL